MSYPLSNTACGTAIAAVCVDESGPNNPTGSDHEDSLDPRTDVRSCRLFELRPDAGHEIVLVKKPWFFGHGGIDSQPVKTGRSFGAITTQGIDVYMQPQKFETQMPDTMTSDGVPIEFHAVMVLQVTDSVALIRTSGPTGIATTSKSSSRRWCARPCASGA